MIDKKLREAMNEQVKHELESCYIYLSMVAYFHSKGLEGMAHWMRCQCHEEFIHAMKFFDHILQRGGNAKLLDLKQLKTTWSSPLEAWKDAYAHEQFITGKINNLISLARERKDYAAEPLLGWFANEQIEEEANTERISSQLELLGEQAKEGILMLDRELAGRVFPAGSPFNPASYAAAAGAPAAP